MGPTVLFSPDGSRASDFIALKNPSSSPGLNPQTLGSVASAMTSRPPRSTILLIRSDASSVGVFGV
jgi:hypothetical protein